MLFLQWSRFHWPWGTNFAVRFLLGVDFIDPEAQIYFLQCTSLLESNLLTLRHQFNLCSHHSLTSRLWACWVCRWYIKNFFCWSQKSVIFLLKSFQLQKFVDVSPLEERAPWSSPFKLAKMIPIWPQNRCISPGLAGNRDFVFPFEWPVSCPPLSSSRVDANKMY